MAIKYIPCPQCGEQIEVDTDKQFAICQNCGKRLKKKTKPSEQTNNTTSGESNRASTQKELTEIEKLFIRANDKEKEYDFNSAIIYYNKILDIDPLNSKARQLLYNAQLHQSTTNTYSQRQVEPKKSKVTAGLLCLFLGGLGVHEFYLGNTGLGVLCLCCTIVFVAFSFTLLPIFFLAVEEIILFIRAITIFASKEDIYYD